MSSGIEFEGDNTQYRRPAQSSPSASSGPMNSGLGSDGQFSYTRPAAKGMTGWLIRKGWVKSEAGAQGLLFGVIGVNIVITIVVLTLFQ